MMTFFKLAPKIVPSAIASASHGITRNQFVNAFRSVSTFVPPKYPDAIPTTAPIAIAPSAATMPTTNDTRAPAISRSSTERPKLSVPSHACVLGGMCGGSVASAGSMSSGLTSSGEAIAIVAKNVKIARPVIPRRLDRNVDQCAPSVARRRDHGLTRRARPTSTCCSISGLLDPGIEVAVRDVRDQVGYDHGCARDQEHRLDDREVQRLDRLICEEAESRPRIDGFDHDRAAEHEPEAQDDQGERRQEGVRDDVFAPHEP